MVDAEATTGPAPIAETNGHKTKGEHYTIPSVETLEAAGDLAIKDEHGKAIPFKSVYEGQTGRQLIVFIRHFYCGVCAINRYLHRGQNL
jgi:hypothetical protein